MSAAAWFTLAVIAAMFVCLVLDVLQPDAVVFCAVGLLLFAGVLTPQEMLHGFANRGLHTVAVLFVVAYAAQSSGILTGLAGHLLRGATGLRRALLQMMLPVVAFSAFLNNTPVVAMLTPAVRDWGLRRGIPPSKLLIPLSYASIFGGICTLIGTSTNLLVDGLYQDSLGRSLGMFDLAWVGLPCAGAGLTFFLLFGYRLLPAREDVARVMVESGREYLFEMRLPAGSPLAGLTVEQARLRHLEGAYLMGLVRGGDTLAPVTPEERLRSGDHLVFVGAAALARNLPAITSLEPTDGRHLCREVFRHRGAKVLELVISRSSPFLGQTLREGNFRGRYDAVVLAVHRNGERLAVPIGRLELRPGDTLLVLAGTDFVKRWNRSREFYMISVVSEVPPLQRTKAVAAAAILVSMVLVSAVGWMPLFTAAVLAAVVLFAGRWVTPVEARRALEINVLVVIAGSLAISRALDKTGAADFLAAHLIEVTTAWGPLWLLAAVYLATSVMTEMITNNAAAALVLPVALAAAGQAGLDPKPFVIAVAVAASASFATPIGYQTNLMVAGPGNYRFVDFVKVGLPMNAVFLATSLWVIPRVWPL